MLLISIGAIFPPGILPPGRKKRGSMQEIPAKFLLRLGDRGRVLHYVALFHVLLHRERLDVP